MRPRVVFSRFLIRMSDFLRTLPAAIMRPADMIEFSRQAYEKAGRVYTDHHAVDRGLSNDELALWDNVPIRTGRLLILGGGGGREAVAFASRGFEVVGVDFSERMLALAKESAARHNLDFTGWVGEISRIDAPKNSFDIVWISMFLYSVVFTRDRRVKMLKRIRKILKPGGVLVCSFYWDPRGRASRKGDIVRKCLAWSTLGNIGFESGDTLFGAIEFRHVFSEEAALRSEFAAGGFEVLHLTIFDKLMRGGGVLRNPSGAGAA